jgi:hypothetical protein
LLEGFNECWIEFEGDGADIIKGRTGLEKVLRDSYRKAPDASIRAASLLSETARRPNVNQVPQR